MRAIVALLVRALRQDTRRLASHMLRGGIALMVLIILFSVIDRRMLMSAPGRVVFMGITWVNYAFISVAAIGFFATSITEEKEEQTLGLMRMAGISPLALLLGKSVSRLWLAIVLIAVQFPFTLLAVTLGGVTLRQVLATYVALAAYTFLLSGTATLCSVVASRSARAVVWMFLASLFLLFLPGIADGLDDAAARYADPRITELIEVATAWLREVSVTTRLQSVMSITFEDPVFEGHFIASLVAGSLAFGLSWLVFDFFANRHVDASPAASVQWLKRSTTLTAGRAWDSAIAWKDFHFLAGGPFGWLARCIVIPLSVAAICLMVASAGGSMNTSDVGNCLIAMSLVFGGAELAVQSARFLTEERINKTLPLLAMTPRALTWTLYAKIAGCLLGLLPTVVLIFVGACMAPETIEELFEDLGRNVDGLMAFGYLVVVIGVYLHLNTLLSTYLKWGAIPVSFGILVAFNLCCVVAVQPGSSMTAAALFFTLSICGMVAMGILQALILDRCRSLVGE